MTVPVDLNALTIARGILGIDYDGSTGNLASIAAPGGIALAYSLRWQFVERNHTEWTSCRHDRLQLR